MGWFRRSKSPRSAATPKTPAAKDSPTNKKEPLLPHRDTDVGVMRPPNEAPVLEPPKPTKPPTVISGGDANKSKSATVISGGGLEQDAEAPPPMATDEYTAQSDDDDTMWIKTKIPNINSKRRWNSAKEKIANCCSGTGISTACAAFTAWATTVPSKVAALPGKVIDLPANTKLAAAGGVTFVVLAILSLFTVFGVSSGARSIFDRQVNVAFIGNSNIFVNDLPRLMESLSNGNIFQDSCLHAGGSMLKIIRTGNGMYNRWTTDAAKKDDVTWYDVNGEETEIYDYGACSVPQLLLGYDPELSYNNYAATFYNDGSNPCLQNSAYLDYTQSFNYSEPWDFVVLADQSKRMSFEEARYEALLAFNYTYIPLLEMTKATPIIVQPHAFWSDNVNMTGLGDVANFTALIREGAKEYQAFLSDGLSRKQAARIAPVGNAFLAVWEDGDNGGMWEKLFLDDGIYPSPYGSYLYGLVVYATVYGHMPKKSQVILNEMDTLWSTARKIQVSNYTGFPSETDAEYLYTIAELVSLNGYVPSSMPNMNE